MLQSLLPGRLGPGLYLTLGLKAIGFGLYGLLPQSLLPCCLALDGFLLQCPLPNRCGALTFGLISGLAGLHLAQGQLARSGHSFSLALPGRLLGGFGLNTPCGLLSLLVGPLGLHARCLRAYLRLTLCFDAFRFGLLGRLAPGLLARLFLDAERFEPGHTQTVGFALLRYLALRLPQGGFCCGQGSSLPFGFGLFNCGPFGLQLLGPVAFHLGLLGRVGSSTVCGQALCSVTRAFVRRLRHLTRALVDSGGLQRDLSRPFGRRQGRRLGR